MPDTPAVEPHIGVQVRADAVIAALAERQHGVVARAQLLEAGLGRRAIGHRIDRGRLHVLHRGVYTVGHRVISREGRWMAAVLAGGRGAVLSHRSAAALWRLHDSATAYIDVTVPRAWRGRRGILAHRAALATDEVAVRNGIRVTSPARTLLDLAAVLVPRKLERAVEQAEALRLTDTVPLVELVARHRGRHGVGAIRRILDAGCSAGMARSELEERFVSFLDAHGLPHPEKNARVETAAGWLEVDCLWRRERVIVELDGYATHGTRAAFERDRARDRALQAAGWRVVRVTWRQLHDAPAIVAAELRSMLDVPSSPL